MNQWLSLLVDSGTSGWALAGTLGIFMLTTLLLGRIIPKSTHERELKMWQDLAEERKEATKSWESVAAANQATLERLVPQMEIVAKFFQEAPKTGDTAGTVDAHVA
jgi:hypothetical protein